MQRSPLLTMTLRAGALMFSAILSTTAAAAELGDISVRSYLGQQLAADIELVSLTPDDINGLQVRLAQNDVYQGANLTMHPALAGVHLSVVRREQRQFLHITTLQTIEDDHLFLFLELSANGHHDVREATLWLQADPHPAPPAAPMPVAAAPSDAALVAARARASRPAAAARAPAVAAAPLAASALQAASATSATSATPAAPAEAKHEASAAAVLARKEPVAPKALAAAIAAKLPSEKAAPKAQASAHAAAAPASSAASPAAALPLPLAAAMTPPLKGAAAPAACAAKSAGIAAKECAALDAHSAALSSKLVELEGKLKLLQMAVDGKAPAGKIHAAGAIQAADPASAKDHAATPVDPAKALAAADAALGIRPAASAPMPAKPGKVLPKLKYKKEKPPEQGFKASTLIAAGAGVLALLGGLGWWLMARRKAKGSAPLQIWQGWRKKKAAPEAAPEAAAPLQEVTPESLLEPE